MSVLNRIIIMLIILERDKVKQAGRQGKVFSCGHAITWFKKGRERERGKK